MVLPLLAPGIQDIQEGILFQLLPPFARHQRLVVVAGISMFLASYAITT